jgi:hypothetical protein
MDDAKLRNIEYFKKELPRLLADPYLQDKFIVIHGEKIQQYHDSFQAALRFALNNFPRTEFAIQHVVDETKINNFIRSAV